MVPSKPKSSNSSSTPCTAVGTDVGRTGAPTTIKKDRTLKDTDVILGRGSGPNQSAGNVRFRQVVWSTFEDFLLSSRKKQPKPHDPPTAGTPSSPGSASASASALASKAIPTPKGDGQDIKIKDSMAKETTATKDSTDKKDKDGKRKKRTMIPDEDYIKPLDASSKNLVARRVVAKMKQNDRLFLRKLPKDEARRIINANGTFVVDAVLTQSHSQSTPTTKARIVKGTDGSVYVEVSTKDAMEKIKQSLRFQVSQKEKELGVAHQHFSSDAGPTSPGSYTVGSKSPSSRKKQKKKRTAKPGDLSYVPSPPLKKRKARSLPSTFPTDAIPQNIILDRSAFNGMQSSQGAQLPLLPFTGNDAGRPLSLASVPRKVSESVATASSLSPKTITNNSVSWPPPSHNTSIQQQIALSQLSVEDAARLLLLSPKTRKNILVAASSATSQIENLKQLQQQQQRKQQEELEQQELRLRILRQEAVARQQQEERTKVLAQLLLQHESSQGAGQATKAASAAAVTSAPTQPISTSSIVSTALRLRQLEQLQQLQLIDCQLQPLPSARPVGAANGLIGQRRSASLDLSPYSGLGSSSSTLLTAQTTPLSSSLGSLGTSIQTIDYHSATGTTAGVRKSADEIIAAAAASMASRVLSSQSNRTK